MNFVLIYSNMQIAETIIKLTQISAHFGGIGLIVTGTTRNKIKSMKTETSQFTQL